MAGSTVRKRMTQAELFRWECRQEQRHELVDGVPQMMVGAVRRHDRIVVNLVGWLASGLRGSACQPFTGDTAVLIPNGNVRRPDVGIDCGRFDDKSMHADAPVLVAEVLSRSTRRLDLGAKLDEYKTVPSLRTILLIEPDRPRIIAWEHEPAGERREQAVEGLDADIAVPALALTLRLAEIYDGLAV